MKMLTDIRVPLAPDHDPELAGFGADRQQQLNAMSERLTSNLAVWLGDEFRVEGDRRALSLGGQWSRDTQVYRDGKLKATFSVSYDSALSPEDVQVSCLLQGPGAARLKLPAVSASILIAAGATAFAGPIAGVLVGGASLLATTLTGVPSSPSSSKARSPRRRSDDPLYTFDVKAGILQPAAAHGSV